MPVKVERTGNRACCTAVVPGSPELSYVASNVDVEGDILLTSSIDGLYPTANIRVATIASVQRSAENPFAVIKCTPTAPGLFGADAVLVLDKPAAPPPRPAADDVAKEAPSKNAR